MWNYITEYFTGKMYSARIYNRTLTDSEVLENYEKTKNELLYLINKY